MSQNDFVCQTIADISGNLVERAVNSDASAIGVAFVAGLSAGVWKDRSDMAKLRKIDRVFAPNPSTIIKRRMDAWERALERFKGWYNHGELPEMLPKYKIVN